MCQEIRKEQFDSGINHRKGHAGRKPRGASPTHHAVNLLKLLHEMRISPRFLRTRSTLHGPADRPSALAGGIAALMRHFPGKHKSPPASRWLEHRQLPG